MTFAPRAVCCVAAALGALATAPTALASSVSVFQPHCAPEQGKYGQCYPDEARFVAAPGEANRVTITRTVDPPAYQPKITIRDDGAALQAGGGCTQIDEHGAECAGYLLVAVIAAGDGDDVVDGPGTLEGGPGDDTLTGSGVLIGGPDDDRLQGGDRGDLLQGGPGRDVLMGGGGNDTLQPDDGEAGDRDTVDGGDGVDVVSYVQRKDGLTVSLLQPLAGEDQLSGVESIRGGQGNDTLTGDAGANAIEGREGNDTLAGGEGDDTVDGGAGANHLDGGAGNDTLYSGGDKKVRNVVVCGDGTDQVARVSVNTLVFPGCERVAEGGLDLLAGAVQVHNPPGPGRAALLTLDDIVCFERPCRIDARVTVASGARRGQLLAARRLVPARGAKPPKRLQVRLTRTGAALVQRRAVATARVTVALLDGADRARASFLLALAKPTER